jgi:hypothetical protein
MKMREKNIVRLDKRAKAAVSMAWIYNQDTFKVTIGLCSHEKVRWLFEEHSKLSRDRVANSLTAPRRSRPTHSLIPIESTFIFFNLGIFQNSFVLFHTQFWVSSTW